MIVGLDLCGLFFFFKQKTAYEMRISDWSSDVCSSDLRMRRPMLMIDLLRHTSGLTYGLQRQTAIDARYRDLGLEELQQKRGSDEFIAALAALPREFSSGVRWNYSVSTDVEVGRGSGRERECKYVEIAVGGVTLKQKKQ